MIIQQIINGVTLGVIYGLVALGYSMVYGILKFVNFAHGTIFMLGAYIGMWFALQFHMGLVPTLLVAMAASAVIGVLTEKVAYRPLRKAARLNVMISAIGVSTFLENVVLKVSGPQTKPFPIILPTGSVTVHGIHISYAQIVIVAISVGLTWLASLFINRTQTGVAIRAASQDLDTTAVMGGNLDNLVTITFAIGSALGGAAGVLVGAYYNAVFPTMDLLTGLKAFVAAVVGGIGSIPGGLLGGLIMGVAEVSTVAFFKSSYRDAVSFVILIIILLIRPAGLLGRQTRVKL